MSRASFASRSGRFGREFYPQGPDPGQYESAFQADTMAAQAKKSMSKNPSAGAFGGRSARDMPWSEKNAQSGEGGANDAPVRSTFAASRGSAPSAAFAGQSNRFAAVPGGTVTPGPGEYKAAPSPLQSSNRINRSSSFGSRSKRFTGIKMEDTPAPGTFAPKAGAFDSASQKRRSSFGAFGGRSVRESPFAAAGGGQNDAPAPGAYDASTTGAFTDRSSGRSKSSAAFASRSSRFGRDLAAQAAAGVPDPGQYNPDTHSGMAREANKTFNKMSSKGGAGFGTSARRPEVDQFAAKEGPAPGSYASDERFGQASDRRSAARPSSAFASKSKGHDGHIRQHEAPAATTYDAHAHTGMAAQATKSFNRLARSGSFGPRAKRQLGEGAHDTPGPGSYSDAKDPLRPSFEVTASSARGSRSSSFASTSQARPSPATWAAGGARGV